MKRLPIISTVIAICLSVMIFHILPREGNAIGIEVTPAKAATIVGGACGNYQSYAYGACTASQKSTCPQYSTTCNGVCSYNCSSTLTFGGSGSYTGQLYQGSCFPAQLPTCTSTLCIVAGAGIPCCVCTGGVQTNCSPSPNDLDTDACSGG